MEQIGIAIGVAILYVVVIYGASLLAAPEAWLDRDNLRVVRARILGVTILTGCSLLRYPTGWTVYWGEVGRTLTILSPVLFIKSLSLGANASPHQGSRPNPSVWLSLRLLLNSLREDMDYLVAGNLVFWRDFVVGPLAEESVFRLAIGSILGPGSYTLWRSAIIFSLAHAHPLLMGNKEIDSVLVQCMFTLLFGLFVGAIYERTRSLITVVLIHAICNRVGFPDEVRFPRSPIGWLLLASLMAASLGAILW